MNLVYINVTTKLVIPFTNYINRKPVRLDNQFQSQKFYVKNSQIIDFQIFSPYSSTSAHTRAEWLHTVVAREKIIVVVTKIFCFSVHVGEVLLIDTVPLCSVAHFSLVTSDTMVQGNSFLLIF